MVTWWKVPYNGALVSSTIIQRDADKSLLLQDYSVVHSTEHVHQPRLTHPLLLIFHLMCFSHHHFASPLDKFSCLTFHTHCLGVLHASLCLYVFILHSLLRSLINCLIISSVSTSLFCHAQSLVVAIQLLAWGLRGQYCVNISIPQLIYQWY